MTKIAITGASGTMGKATLKALMNSKFKFSAKILLLNSDLAFGTKMKMKYKSRIEVIYGDIRSLDDCAKLVDGCDYVMHLASIIPPKADHDQDATISVNYGGTKNMIDAVKNLQHQPKFIHISTVAIYGHRNHVHPWGRVGDPLLPSIFDVYATSKMKAERYVLESGLSRFAVIRQTGILHDNLLMNNVGDGLMFHTPWNLPIEWVTDVESGILMTKIVEKDLENGIPEFWQKVYNLGGGKGFRETGYDTFDNGFKMIGGSVESFFEPHWNATRNFHCFWFSDSHLLDDIFHFQNDNIHNFWEDFKKRHPIYSIARILPPSLIRKLVIEPLLRDKNAPMRWVRDNYLPRVEAAYGDNGESKKTWSSFPLLKDGKIGKKDYPYAEIKANPDYMKLNHGYDESKMDSELDIEDMRAVAEFRGGQCLSDSMVKGDLYTPLKWCCHKGHVFYASPYTIMKAGHWCSECASLTSWDYDSIAPYVPFYQQVWYDSRTKEENFTYSLVHNQAYRYEGACYEN